MDGTRWPTYALRSTLAAIFVLAGLDHATDAGGLAWALAGWFPWPDPAGYLVAYGELLAGLGLAAGALFALSAAVAGFIALAAMAVILLTDGVVVWQDLVMVGAAVYVVAHGPGPAAVDDALVRRWPSLARWLRPWQGEGARRAGRRAFQLGIVAALGAVFLQDLARGAWTSASAERIAPLLGPVVFGLRPVVAVLVLAGAWPRAAGTLLAVLGLLPVLGSPSDYHAFALIGAGAALAAWPREVSDGLPPVLERLRPRRWRAAAGPPA